MVCKDYHYLTFMILFTVCWFTHIVVIIHTQLNAFNPVRCYIFIAYQHL